MEKIPDNVKRAYEDGKRRKIMRFRMMKLIAAVLSALLLFGGCQSARRTEPVDGTGAGNATEQTPPLPEETPSETETLPVYPTALPETVDPLGFYRLQQEENLTADLAAEKFDAKYERVPGLYEIKNVYMGGRDVRLWLQTNEDETRIRQITLVQVYSHHLYETLYHEIVAVLGEPDGLYLFDYQANKRVRTEEFILPEEKPLYSVWDLEGYTLELGANFPGNMEQGFYLAAFQGEYDEKMAGCFYEQDGPCCPHETNFHFTEECIFLDPELFQSEAAEVFKKYRAVNAYEWETSRRYPGDYSYQYEYVVDGVDYLGQNARFVFTESESGSGKLYHAGYEIDITNASADAVKDIFLQIYDAFLACSATSRDSDIDPHTLGPEAFDARNWDKDHHIYYVLRLDSENFTLQCSSGIRWKDPLPSTIYLSWSY